MSDKKTGIPKAHQYVPRKPRCKLVVAFKRIFHWLSRYYKANYCGECYQRWTFYTRDDLKAGLTQCVAAELILPRNPHNQCKYAKEIIEAKITKQVCPYWFPFVKK